MDPFDGGFLGFGRVGGAGVAKVTRFSAAEAESFLLAVLLFLRGEFGDFDGINIHCVGVTSFRRGGECLVGVGRFDVLPSDFVGTIPLSLEMDSFFVPVTNSGRDSVHGHNAAHEGGRDSGRVVSDEDVFIVDFRHGVTILSFLLSFSFL